jgi:hypothetical protein
MRVCPRCQFHNPGWTHLCDRCGADLRQVNVHQAVSKASEPRGRSFFTLLEAWGGAIAFNRLYAFLPEVDLASGGRSLTALIMASLFAIIWQPLVLLILRLATGRVQRQTQILTDVLRVAGRALPSILLLALTCLPIALLTWAAARLVGGKQGLTVHFHLTLVAFSAWIVLSTLLGSLVTLLPYLLTDTAPSLFDGIPALIGAAVSIAGAIWLIQATQTAHDLSLVRAMLVAIVTAALGALIAFSLGALTGKSFTDILIQFATAPFLALSNLP